MEKHVDCRAAAYTFLGLISSLLDLECIASITQRSATSGKPPCN